MPSRTAALFLAIAALVFAGCLEPTSTPPATNADEGARAFGLAVIGTYFDQDQDAFRAMLADTIYTLEGEGPFTHEQVDSWLAAERPFPAGRDYSNWTIDDYLATYAPEILTFDEARLRFPEFAELRWEGWTPSAADRIFFGSTLREGKESFLWDDLLSFALTPEDEAWRFKAFSG